MNGRKLKGIRVEKGLSQPPVAKHLGINTSTYCQKENDKYPFTVEEVGKLAELLDMNVYQVDEVFFDQKLTNRAS
jgi:DNA-binding XRE family transcriptional regulator